MIQEHHTDQDKHAHDHVHKHAVAPVTVYAHEGASIGSVELTYNGTLEQLEPIASERMKHLAEWVEMSGGIVGHIKGNLSEERSSFLSVTDGETMQIQHPEGKIVHFRLAVIVFGPSLKELEKELVKQFKTLSL